jgi:pimeloyl-ACP methyl ester carboxylesterase
MPRSTLHVVTNATDAVPARPSTGAVAHEPTGRGDVVSIEEVIVDTKRVHYTVGGTGPTVLFLHGWGLGHHAYRAGLRKLAHHGYHVVAPALPGFGGTPDLEPGNRTFVGYARWLTRFVKATGIRPTLVVGHSFGGGVAIRALADTPGFADGLVLLNSVGGSWRHEDDGDRPMAERPIWDWGRAIPGDVVGLLGGAGSILPSLFQDLVPNVLRNPFGVAKVGRLARNADLVTVLRALAQRGVPITIIHSENDGVIPASSFVSLCSAAGVEGQRIKGIHSWPLTSPVLFAELVADAASRLPKRIAATA